MNQRHSELRIVVVCLSITVFFSSLCERFFRIHTDMRLDAIEKKLSITPPPMTDAPKAWWNGYDFD